MGSIILIDTLIYALLTILGLGSVLYPVIQRCDVQEKPKLPKDPTIKREKKNRNCCHGIKYDLAKFDATIFSPLFIKDLRNIQKRAVDSGELSFIQDFEDRVEVKSYKQSQAKGEIASPFQSESVNIVE